MHLNLKREMVRMSSIVKIFMIHKVAKSSCNNMRTRYSLRPSKVSSTTDPVVSLRTPKLQ